MSIIATNENIATVVQKKKVLPAVHSNWPILAKLLFSFVHLANEIDESLP